MNESCHTYEWVMSQIWMSHVTHMNESCHTYEWVMSHIWTRHVTHMTESCHRYSHIWMSHVTHMNESCHIYEHTSHVTHMNESCHTYEHVMWHIWLSRVTHTNESCHTRMNESCHTYEWVPCHTYEWASQIFRVIGFSYIDLHIHSLYVRNVLLRISIVFIKFPTYVTTIVTLNIWHNPYHIRNINASCHVSYMWPDAYKCLIPICGMTIEIRSTHSNIRHDVEMRSNFSNMWHDDSNKKYSFQYVAWRLKWEVLSPICGMTFGMISTHSNMRHDVCNGKYSFQYVASRFLGVVYHIHVWHDAFIRVMWYDMRAHGAFVNVTWRIHKCDMTHS